MNIAEVWKRYELTPDTLCCYERTGLTVRWNDMRNWSWGKRKNFEDRMVNRIRVNSSHHEKKTANQKGGYR